MTKNNFVWKVSVGLWVWGALSVSFPLAGWGVDVGGHVGTSVKAEAAPRIQVSYAIKHTNESGRFDDENWRIGGGYAWEDIDKDPPPVTQVDGWGNFILRGIPVDIGSVTGGMTSLDSGTESEGATRNGAPTDTGTTDDDDKLVYRPAGVADNGLPYDFKIPGIFQGSGASTGASSTDDEYWYIGGAYRIQAGYGGYSTNLRPEGSSLNGTIDNKTPKSDSWIYNFDWEGLRQLFTDETGIPATKWDPFESTRLREGTDGSDPDDYVPALDTFWIVPDDIRWEFNGREDTKDYWLLNEMMAVIYMAPAQGLEPHTWVQAQDPSPVAQAYFRRSGHE